MEENKNMNQENQELENQNQENGKPETPAEEKEGFFKKAGRTLKKAATSKIACTVYGILGGTVAMGVIGKVFGKEDVVLPSGGSGTVPMITEKVPEIAESVSEAVVEATEK